MGRYEYDFDASDENNTASSVYRMVRPGGSRVLDLGSGPGIVAARLVAEDKKDVVCVDSAPEAVAAARERGVERVIEADLAGSEWLSPIAGEQFDVIVMADVLEHLVHPEALLDAIAGHDLLSTDGYLVISIPNAGHEAVLAELIRGRFTYQDTGLLDSTHVRWFTLASLRELLERYGFFITRVERTRRTAEQTSLAIHDVALPDDLRDRILESAPEAQTYQFIVKAERAEAARELADVRELLAQAEAQLAERDHIRRRGVDAEVEAAREAARSRIASLESELAEQRRDRAVLEQRLVELESALGREQRFTAEERKRYEQLLAAATSAVGHADMENAQRQISRLEKKLDDVYGSRTWKVGRAAWTAFHAPAKLMRRGQKPTTPDRAAPATRPEIERAGEFTLEENAEVRAKYEAALESSEFSGSGSALAIAVFTDDLDSGRGDVYTAVGLGRHLEEIGYEVIYLPQERWYDVPEGTEIYLAMLETVDVTRLPADITTVAWIRNQTAVWAAQPWLALYDLVLASSQQSLDAISTSYPGPTGLLPIGVDTELFAAEPAATQRHGVTSTVNQWGREREVFSYLKQRPPTFPLALYGQQRGAAAELVEHAKGPISFFSLPSLYRQAEIVLDDFNHTTAGFGNVNSRVFEAAACGAQVLTNRAIGLAPLGLAEIGVFTSARELFDLIDHGLHSDEARSTARRVSEVVTERHDYARRAVEFRQHLDRLGSAKSADDVVVLSYFPDYRDNPYLEMMWSELRNQRAVAIAVDNRLDFTATIKAAAHRPTVFHLNWTAPILGGAVDERDRLTRHRRFVEALDEMRRQGIPLIWTIHNVLPHECADPDLEARLRQEIADRVDVIHVMCEETVAACSDWFDIPPSKVRTIPHPSYVDVYPNLADRDTARRELRLDPDEFVYLHLGQIRPYKGIDRLLDAFDQVVQVDPGARLLLAGRPGKFEGVRQLTDRAHAHPRVVSNFNPVPDGDIQLYMNAADVVVLPHQSALNSGVLLLAYSFARPVVSAAVGCLTGLVDSKTGITFDPDGGTLALQNAMLSARGLGREHGEAAYQRAQDLHYLGIGRRFAAIVDELLG